MTSRKLFLRLLLMTNVYALLVVFAAAPVIFAGTGLTDEQVSVFIVYILPIVALATTGVDTLTLYLLYRPLARGLAAIERGERNALQIQSAYVRAMNFPVWMFARIVFIHTPTGTITSTFAMMLGASMLGIAIPDWQNLTVNALIATIGVSHAILEYLVTLYLIRPVIPQLEAHLHSLPHTGITRVSTRLRLFLLSVWMFMMPMAIVSVIVVVRVNRMLADLGINTQPFQFQSLILWLATFLISISLLIFFMARLMANEMQTLIQQLSDGMKRIAAGNLQTSLDVTTTDEFADLYRGFNSMSAGLREREHLHDAFGRYVSPELAQRVLSGELNMQGKLVQATVMFVDIRGFTALSEKLSAPQVVELLNCFFAQVEPVIKAHGGWINKFLGDGFMVTFGAPVAYPDHAARAVQTALAIREALRTFNQQQPQPVSIGIGIESGEMVAGSIGSPERLEYTVIGDTVNVASRIESLNKEMNSEILISQRVYDAANTVINGHARAMPPAQVKGKAQPLQVYAL